MKTNIKTATPVALTHEGARASRASIVQQLRRAVMACLLWEGEFYVSGEDIATRIKALVKANKAEDVAEIAIEARTDMKLRHVPLMLVREMARNPEQRALVGDTLEKVIQRADEVAEFLSLYWKDGKDQPIASQVKKGLARALRRFSEYELAKWNRDADVKLRDVLFLVHPRPADAKGNGHVGAAVKTATYQRGKVRRHSSSVFTRLAEDTLKTPDT